jgi:hypothetical protein
VIVANHENPEVERVVVGGHSLRGHPDADGRGVEDGLEKQPAAGVADRRVDIEAARDIQAQDLRRVRHDPDVVRSSTRLSSVS